VRLDSVEAEAIRKALEKTGGHRGEAARQLGISRRTLTRRLREYGFASMRRPAPPPLGSISYQQQRDLRVPARFAVTLQTSDGRELTCAALDLSAGGMGVEKLDDVLDQNSEVQVAFQLPDSEDPTQVAARVAWVDNAQGRAGLAFCNVTTAARQKILQWLRQQMVSEGWNIQPEPSGQPEPTGTAPVPPGPTWANLAQ
jgi:Tfp pilus assembly protein PilZ